MDHRLNFSKRLILNVVFLFWLQNLPTSTSAQAVMTSQPSGLKFYENLRPGATAPDVVKVDADYIYDIIEGTCIIKKGNLQALIDLKGDFIVPWGKYDFSYARQINIPRFKKLILVKKPNELRFGYINTKGEVIIPIIYITPGEFDIYGFARMGTINEFAYYINEKNQPIPATLHAAYVNEMHERAGLDEKQVGLVRYQKNGLYGFVNIQGKVIIPPIYTGASQFTEGLASVRMPDEFGVSKWGYIDITGKLVIPYKFTIQPGNFHEGLALVAPLNVEEAKYNFAYIDRTGNISLTVGSGSRTSRYAALKENDGSNANITNGSFFIGDHAFWYNEYQNFIIDRTGKITSVADFIKRPEQYNMPKELYFVKYSEKGIHFRLSNANFKENVYGIVDFYGNILFPPFFSSIKPDFFGPFAIASTITKSEPNKPEITNSGVINPQGVFILILSRPETF